MPDMEWWWIVVDTEEKDIEVKSLLVAWAMNEGEGPAFNRTMENATLRFIECGERRTAYISPESPEADATISLVS
jgi:hypothetical protein